MTLPLPASRSPHELEPIVVIADRTHALEMLRLAVLRSDAVCAVLSDLDAPTRRFVDAFAVELRQRPPRAADLDGARAGLIALTDVPAENELVRAARQRGIPIYVAERALVSDFTPLDLVEQRPLVHSAA